MNLGDLREVTNMKYIGKIFATIQLFKNYDDMVAVVLQGCII